MYHVLFGTWDGYIASVLLVLSSAGLCGKPLQLSHTTLLASVGAVSQLQMAVQMTMSQW